MTHLALDHYTEEMKKEGSFVSEYAEENTEFSEKLEYVSAVRQYMEYRLVKAGETGDLSKVKTQVEETLRDLLKNFELPDDSGFEGISAIYPFLRNPVETNSRLCLRNR